ncbi:enoyl-CoA hydratase/isomerase family protein [Rhizobium esperanzae]|uniref:Enoyl-CoA hydratase n=1 Tax=Rhizobium esperanzae TaxID=1967781 RepID=A0A7W6R393_9HYPH|nr:enoyl-CoA hydratase/isomerase family protein [Rhizobium esperanzae]MBB4235884.1 enoyl-CoA hydratase [Rhizobium esperanzae]
MFETLLFEVDDRVAVVTINRPDRMNAINDQLTVEYRALMAELDGNDDVRVIIVRGAGDRAFSAGYDLKEYPGAKRNIEQINDRYLDQQEFLLSNWRCSKPVIAMIDGFCLAGGLELALCCDIRYCSDRSQIGVLEARFAGAIGTMMAPWILGNKCRELIYTGDILDAHEALEVGLVERVFPTASLFEETLLVAKRMSRVAANCQRWNKRSINQSFETMGLFTALRHGADMAAMMRTAGSPERDMFDDLRTNVSLQAALDWRKQQFAPFEKRKTIPSSEE